MNIKLPLKQGSYPGGGKWGPLQGKNSSESVGGGLGAAGWPGSADLAAEPTVCRNVTHLCFDLILPNSRLAENHRFCHSGVGCRSSFPCSTKYSQFLSFLWPKFELVPFPHLQIPLIFSISAHSSRRHGSKKYGLTPSPISSWRRGHGYLFLNSTDQTHKSRLEMFHFFYPHTHAAPSICGTLKLWLWISGPELVGWLKIQLDKRKFRDRGGQQAPIADASSCSAGGGETLTQTPNLILSILCWKDIVLRQWRHSFRLVKVNCHGHTSSVLNERRNWLSAVRHPRSVPCLAEICVFVVENPTTRACTCYSVL